MEIKRYRVKQTFTNSLLRHIMFFSLISLARASIVDDSYSSHQDLYDAILNTLFPITFVVLLKVSEKRGGGDSGVQSDKNIRSDNDAQNNNAAQNNNTAQSNNAAKSFSMKDILLPLLDDVLYNVVTWVIPLTVSFAYNNSLALKIFSIVNMCLHITCALIALIKWKQIGNLNGNTWLGIFFFLIFFPVLVIPIFWITYLVTNHMVASINLLFIVLFGILLVLISILLIITFDCVKDSKITDTIGVIIYVTCFYAPNFLQTLLILLTWPINFYFVKTCVFVLVLSLTRNISYYTEEVPDDFLATSTAMVQCGLRLFIDE